MIGLTDDRHGPRGGLSDSAEAGDDRSGADGRALQVGPTPPVAAIDVALPATGAPVLGRDPPIEGRPGSISSERPGFPDRRKGLETGQGAGGLGPVPGPGLSRSTERTGKGRPDP